MHADLTGFYKSPITFAFFLFYSIFAISSFIFDLHHPNLQQKHTRYYNDLHQKKPFFDFVYQSSFLNLYHACLGIFIIYRCRFMERFLGSAKFGSFCFLNCLMTYLFYLPFYYPKQTLIQLLFRPFSPYVFLGGIITLYYVYMPKSQPRLFFFGPYYTSEKIFAYFAFFMIFLSSNQIRLSMIAGLCNGILYNIFSPLKNFVLPNAVTNTFMILKPLFDVVPPSIAQQRRRQRLQQAGYRTDGSRRENNVAGERLLPGLGSWPSNNIPPLRNTQNASNNPLVISESNIQALMDMGFPREEVEQALQRNQNNLEQALNSLLQQ